MTDEEIKDKMYNHLLSIFEGTLQKLEPRLLQSYPMITITGGSNIVLKALEKALHNPDKEEQILLNQAINRVKIGEESIEESCDILGGSLTNKFMYERIKVLINGRD